MAGIKIINVLKDDTFPDILELFRHTDAKEVIFVLPKNGKVLRSEDHFAAFASEAAGAGKTISLLCNNPQTTSWARKYAFNVMSSGKPAAPAKKAKAKLVTQPPPQDEDIQEENTDAFQRDVPETSDETMGITSPDEVQDETDPLHGMHIEDETGVDYIDAMWRQKAQQSVAQMASSRGPRLPSLPFKLGRPSRNVAVGILAASAVVLGAIVYMTTGAAHIVIIPVARPVDTQLTVQTSDVFSAVDGNFNKIPGQLFEVTKTAVHEAAGTGQRDVASKARGKIAVSNAFSNAPQVLVATTRFESSDGLIFRTLRTVTVPGSGTVTVDVIADKPGAQYNILAGTFTIPAFKERGDTERYAKFTATSATTFAGGASGPSKVVTQENYDAAKNAATAEAKAHIMDAFAQQATGMKILDGVEPVVTTVSSTAQPDDAADTFTVSVTATLRTVAFRPADLGALIAQSVLKKDHLTVLPDRLTLTYRDILFKADLGVLVFTTSVKGTGYVPVDNDTVTSAIKGLNSARIHEYFSGQEGVASATVSLSPFWVRSVPDDPRRVQIQVQYDGH